MDRTGQIIEDYRLTDKLSEDGYVSLYEGKQGRTRAQIKIIDVTDPEGRRCAVRFLQGAQALKRVQHAALARILACGRWPDGSAYLISQPAEGELLSDVLSRQELRGAARFSVLHDLAASLAACHAQQVSYLNMQPRQVVIHQRPGSGHQHAQLLETDTALAEAKDSAPLPTLVDGDVDDRFAIIHYLAPEYFTSQYPINDKADLYAFGVLAYQVLCGQPPFVAKQTGELIAHHVNRIPAPLRSRAGDVPESAARLVHALLSKDPEKRPALTVVAAELARHMMVTLPPSEDTQNGGPLQDEPPPTHFGEYKVLRKLGSGGMGTVYEVESPLQRRAAIKVLHPALARQPQFTERFLTEVRAANIVNHPGIISILHTGQTEAGRPYIVMEHLDGQDLRTRLESGRLPVAQVIQLGWQLALALTAAHQKSIVHRDLKPENIMLVPDPTVSGEERTKILDFGIARVREGQQAANRQLTRAGAIMGTPQYMSPEQIQDSASVSEPADVYSLGVILYEMLAGGLPAGRPLLGAPCPIDLARFIQRMQSFDPQQRPSAAEVAAELARMRAAVPLTMGSVPPQAPSSPTDSQSASAATPARASTATSNIGRWVGLSVGAGVLVAAGGLVLVVAPTKSSSTRTSAADSPKQVGTVKSTPDLSQVATKELDREIAANKPDVPSPPNTVPEARPRDQAAVIGPPVARRVIKVKIYSIPSGAFVYQLTDLPSPRPIGTTPLFIERPKSQMNYKSYLLKRDGYFDKKITISGNDETINVNLRSLRESILSKDH